LKGIEDKDKVDGKDFALETEHILEGYLDKEIQPLPLTK
jgi:hypothetical protein